MRKINIFISSNMHELEYGREIAREELEDINVNPVLFELFPAMNQSPVEAYIEEIKNCDIFIMILWKSLKDSVLLEYKEAIKSNNPIIILVKSLVGNEHREDKLKVFLDELNSPLLHQVFGRTVYKNFRHYLELKYTVKESVMNEITKFYREPIHTLSREEMYELGRSIINYAQKRLFLFQRTPSLFLGARNYLATDSNKYVYELEFLKSLEMWIENNCKINDFEFLYLFSVNATKEDLSDNNLLTKRYFSQKFKNSKQENFYGK